MGFEPGTSGGTVKNLETLLDFQRTSTEPAMYDILVVDDEPVLRRLLNSILGLRKDLRVTTCSSGPEALREIDRRGRSFDLVITDLLMPGMSGTELANQIRRHLPETPVLAFSGTLQDCPTPEQFDDVLAKPFSLSEVHALVGKHCPPANWLGPTFWPIPYETVSGGFGLSVFFCFS